MQGWTAGCTHPSRWSVGRRRGFTGDVYAYPDGRVVAEGKIIAAVPGRCLEMTVEHRYLDESTETARQVDLDRDRRAHARLSFLA